MTLLSVPVFLIVPVTLMIALIKTNNQIQATNVVTVFVMASFPSCNLIAKMNSYPARTLFASISHWEIGTVFFRQPTFKPLLIRVERFIFPAPVQRNNFARSPASFCASDLFKLRDLSLLTHINWVRCLLDVFPAPYPWQGLIVYQRRTFLQPNLMRRKYAYRLNHAK